VIYVVLDLPHDFRSMTSSPLHLVVNRPVFFNFIFAVLLLRYNFKCLFKKF